MLTAAHQSNNNQQAIPINGRSTQFTRIHLGMRRALGINDEIGRTARMFNAHSAVLCVTVYSKYLCHSMHGDLHSRNAVFTACM
mmetsp:Transcript_13922/g.38258  ORF Transcript_13922/g.38258 Transcript_13922/m.38258 type:complete len:84 (+) Transcript_13922:223-474(+)